MKRIFIYLIIYLSIIIGFPWWLVSITSYLITGYSNLYINIGIPLLLFSALYFNWKNVKDSNELLRKIAANYLDVEEKDIEIISDVNKQGFCFINESKVLLISAKSGNAYLKELDVDSCAWAAIRNSKGEYVGIEIIPPRDARPLHGSIKIRARSNSLSANAKADYKFHGIPLY